MNSSNWITALYGSASIISGFLAKIIKFKNFITISKQNDTINEILFYGSDDEEQNIKMGLNNLFCIYYVIVHASKTIDVCLPTLRSETISKCLLTVHQNNHIKVRVIVHKSDDFINLKSFLDCGIAVKIVNSGVKLEHEFLLIDTDNFDAVAIVGSLDYEVNRVNCNRDSTLLTSEITLISNLKLEFARIWNSTPSYKNLSTDE